MQGVVDLPIQEQAWALFVIQTSSVVRRQNPRAGGGVAIRPAPTSCRRRGWRGEEGPAMLVLRMATRVSVCQCDSTYGGGRPGWGALGRCLKVIGREFVLDQQDVDGATATACQDSLSLVVDVLSRSYQIFYGYSWMEYAAMSLRTGS